jgi:aspartyl-tRNA(Asn)/glutamyl-tRNA(Gln) amidotransferase subunit A
MTENSDLVFKSASELGPLIKARKVSPVEVTQAFLERVDSLNPKLNAFITITREQAIERAQQAEKEIQSGRYIGPLHGIPYAAKDLLATRGIRTTNASKHTESWIPDHESTATDRLNKAGAILVGKLNLSEYAMSGGAFGLAKNPWHPDYTASGSSSGSGVAAAASLVPLTLGSDTGGSIISPSASNGAFGVKPTYGRVSRYGASTLGWTLDHVGLITRTVRDAALMLHAIAGHDPNDKSSSTEPVPDYTRSLTRNIKGIRIGVPTNYFFEDLEPDVNTNVRKALITLKDMGAVLNDVRVPHAEHVPGAGWIIAMAEGSTYHEKRLREHPERFGPTARDWMETARFYTATDYIKSMRLRTIVQQDLNKLFETCDVLAWPSSRTLPGKITGGAPRANPGPPRPVGQNTFIGNMSGYPTMGIVCGFSSQSPTLPVALMFLGKPFDEATLFRVCDAYESATEWHTKRPPV